MKLRRLVVPHRVYPISTSPQATRGALAIYAEGRRKDDAQQMLFGLSVLRSASEDQLQAARVTFAPNLRVTIGVGS
jgi:hypothetical protein